MTNEQEREHCELALIQLSQGNVPRVDWLLSERAAARAEGEAAGWRMACTEWEPITLRQRELVEDRRQEIVALQSKHERLVTAARAYLEHKSLSKRSTLDAALADEPSFDTLNQHGFERMIAAADARYLRLATAARAFFDAVCKTDQCIEVGVFAALNAALADSPETVNWRERYEELLELATKLYEEGRQGKVPSVAHLHQFVTFLLQNQPKGEGAACPQCGSFSFGCKPSDCYEDR